MAYPPDLPPSTRTDSTISAVNHASDHNKLAAALASLVEVLGANPAAGYADLSSRLLGIATGEDQGAIDAFNDAVAAVSALSGIDTTDDAIEALLTTVLGPKTQAAISTALPTIYSSFDRAAAGALPNTGVLDSGHAYTATKSGGTGFDVVDGELTAATGLQYLNIAPVRGPVREFWLPAKWEDDGHALYSDAVAVAIVSAEPFALDVPNYAAAGLHLLHRRKGFVVQNRAAGADGDPTQEYFYDYTEPLAFGEVHTIGALWDGKNLIVITPQGIVVPVPFNADRVAWWGNHTCVEIVAGAALNPVTIGKFRISSDPSIEPGSAGTGDAPAPPARPSVSKQLKVQPATLPDGTTAVPFTLVSTFTTVLTLSVVIPESLAIEVEADLPILTPATGNLSVQMNVDGNPTATESTTAIEGMAYSGNLPVRLTLNLSAFTPGTTRTINVRLAHSGTGALFRPNNSGPRRVASVTYRDADGIFA